VSGERCTKEVSHRLYVNVEIVVLENGMNKDRSLP